MKGLILKDLYSLKVYMRQYVILLGFFMIFGVSMGNTSYIMWMSLVMALNIGFATFPVDEAGGYTYMLACPVGRRMCVQAKYLVGIGGVAVILACSVIGEILNRLFSVGMSDIRLWLVEIGIILGIYLFFSSILIPVSYKYGVEKSRIVMMGMIAVPIVIGFLSVRLIEVEAVTKILDRIARAFTGDQLISFGAFFFFLVSLLAMGGSYLLSVKIFERKEF